jgi:GTP-binding protein Era
MLKLECINAWQEEQTKLDQRMMQNVRRAAKDADAIMLLVDSQENAADALPLIEAYNRNGSVPMAVILNKVRIFIPWSITGQQPDDFQVYGSEQRALVRQIDLLTGLKEQQLVSLFSEQPGVDTVIPVSALKGNNVKAVEDWAISKLPEGPSLYPKVDVFQI